MIKSILNLEGVQALSKEVQKEVNGGSFGSLGACSVVCQSGGGRCGPAHCPAVCTGPGQWVYL